MAQLSSVPSIVGARVLGNNCLAVNVVDSAATGRLDRGGQPLHAPPGPCCLPQGATDSAGRPCLLLALRGRRCRRGQVTQSHEGSDSRCCRESVGAVTGPSLSGSALLPAPPPGYRCSASE